MKSEIRETPEIVIAGLSLCMAAILFGFVLGGTFGLIEDTVKGQLSKSGDSALESVYDGDVATMDAVVAKSWDYLKRAHLHGGAIGAAGVSVILALIVLSRMTLVARLSALAFGIGAIVYPVFWLIAGFIAPGMGGTGAAKDALEFLAIPGAGLTLAGSAGSLYCIIRDTVFPVDQEVSAPHLSG